MPKYDKFSDYMIKDGKLVGEFDAAYQDFEDPWGHIENDRFRTSHFITVGWLQHIAHKKNISPENLKVVEVGSGLGNLTSKIHNAGFDVKGLEVSKTAVDRASTLFPNCQFEVGDLLDISFEEVDVIVLAEVTWFILDKLDEIIKRVKNCDCELIQMMATYPNGVQKYGTEYFTTLDEIESYFSCRNLKVNESYSIQSDVIQGYAVVNWFSPI